MKIVLFIALFTLTTMWACIDGDPLHVITRADDNNGNVFRDTLYALEDTSIVEGKISTAFGTNLLLGTHADFEARFLLEFGSLPADTFQIDSLRLMLTAASNQGEALFPITGSAYRVTEAWGESVNEDEDWDYTTKIDYSPDLTANFEISEETASYHIIDLPPALMDAWRDTVGGDNNHGLLLDFNDAGYIKEFRSVDAAFSGERPRLIAVYYDSAVDSVVHDTSFVNIDASLIDFKGSFDPNIINISSGYSVRSFFKFDLSSIPKLALMSTFDLVLKRDTLNSVINTNTTERFSLRTVTSEYEELPVYEVDSTYTTNFFYSVQLVESSTDILQIDPLERGNAAQTFFQAIINGDINYESFLVHYKIESNDISVYSVKNSSDPNPENRPMLIFEYYVIPEPRL